MADINSILNELKQERNRLDAAIAALEGGRRGAPNRRNKPGPRPGKGTQGGKRRLSAAARKRISQAAKARWAAAKQAGKNAL